MYPPNPLPLCSRCVCRCVAVAFPHRIVLWPTNAYIQTHTRTALYSLTHSFARLTNTRCFRQRTVYVYGPTGIHVYGIPNTWKNEWLRHTDGYVYIRTYMYVVQCIYACTRHSHTLCNCVVMRIYEYIQGEWSECVRILLPYIHRGFFRFHFIRKHS